MDSGKPENNGFGCFSMEENEQEVFINFMKISNGCIVQADTIEYKNG